jgi:ParB/RepB/Spo0J family partition protein
MSDQVEQIAVTLIRPGKNHRREFDPEKLAELADSIGKHGLAQPITVRPVGEGYEIVAGERRFRAISELLKWAYAPCLVRAMSDEEAEVIMGIENLQRADLLPLEEAEVYRRQADAGKTPTEIGRLFGVSSTKVKARLVLYDLAPEYQQMVNKGQLPLGHAVRLAVLDVNRQREAVRWLTAQPGLVSERIFGQYVEKLLASQQQDSLFNLSFFAAPEVDTAVQEAEGDLAKLLPPPNSDLPEVVFAGSMAEMMDGYVATLLETDPSKAEVLIHFWRSAMSFNYMRLSPYESKVLEKHGARLVQGGSS